MSISSISRRDIEEIYGLENWGAGYFSVSRRGHLMVHTQPSQAPGIDIKAIVDTLGARFISPLHAFTNYLITSVARGVRRAIARGYRGQYRGVFPIKVNQRKEVVAQIVRAGRPMITVWRWGANPSSPPPWPYMIIHTRC